MGVDSGGVLRLVGTGQNSTSCSPLIGFGSKYHNDKPVQSLNIDESH